MKIIRILSDSNHVEIYIDGNNYGVVGETGTEFKPFPDFMNKLVGDLIDKDNFDKKQNAVENCHVQVLIEKLNSTGFDFEEI